MTRELLDKVGEVEANLQSHTQFQDRMNRLSDWVVITHQTIMTRGLNPVQAQVDLEDHLNSSQNPSQYTSPQSNDYKNQNSEKISYLLQALEASMRDRKKDLEDLLAHSIELQKRQQLLPQEKVSVSFFIVLVLFNKDIQLICVIFHIATMCQ